ncbi:MAG: methyltransferase, partial [Dehalococcoidales bacterium]|nr:methyltransferase [Dehalococcoidales bacterium]
MTDIYYKKTLTYKYSGRELQFRVSQDLFSSFQVDLGTQFLIRTLTLGQDFPYKKILDLGCGYGPI